MALNAVLRHERPHGLRGFSFQILSPRVMSANRAICRLKGENSAASEREAQNERKNGMPHDSTEGHRDYIRST